MTKPLTVDAPVVARLFKLSPSSIYRLARTNKLPFPHIGIGEAVRFRVADIEEFYGSEIDEEHFGGAE